MRARWYSGFGTRRGLFAGPVGVLALLLLCTGCRTVHYEAKWENVPKQWETLVLNGVMVKVPPELRTLRQDSGEVEGTLKGRVGPLAHSVVKGLNVQIVKGGRLTWISVIDRVNIGVRSARWERQDNAHREASYFYPAGREWPELRVEEFRPKEKVIGTFYCVIREVAPGSVIVVQMATRDFRPVRHADWDGRAFSMKEKELAWQIARNARLLPEEVEPPDWLKPGARLETE